MNIMIKNTAKVIVVILCVLWILGAILYKSDHKYGDNRDFYCDVAGMAAPTVHFDGIVPKLSGKNLFSISFGSGCD